MADPARTTRLLVVDDDRVFRTALASAFVRRGYDVRAAGSVHEALEVCAAGFAPERAVVDQRMVGGSGLELLRELRERYPHVSVVMLTGYGSIPSAVEATKLGATNYLTKPAEPAEIEAAFDHAVRIEAVEATATPSLDRASWEHIQRVLGETGNNVSETARRLGIDRRTLQRRLQKLPSRR